MIKHFCDHCRKEILYSPICLDFLYFAEKYELCEECAEEIRDFIEEGREEIK